MTAVGVFRKHEHPFSNSKEELDGMHEPFVLYPIRVRWATSGATISFYNLPNTQTNCSFELTLPSLEFLTTFSLSLTYATDDADLEGLTAIGCDAYDEYRMKETRIRSAC